MSGEVGAGARRLGKEAARRGLFEVKTIVARYPAVAIRLARRRHGIPVGDDTEIVIEGFPRTGTSFAVAAFDLAQGGEVRIACHVHAPAQVIEGVRRDLPNIVLVREPEDTVLSFVIRNPHIPVRQALRGYLRFYRPLLPLRDRIVAALFSEVTTDFGGVIRRVNERFGTGFMEFENTEANVRRCFAAIDEDYRRRLPAGPGLEREVARPSEWRSRLKEELRPSYRDPRLAARRAEAEHTFRAFLEE